MIERHRKMTGRVDLAEEDLCQRRTTGLTRIPRHDFRIALRHIECRACRDHGHKRLASFRKRIQHPLLTCRNIQRYLITGSKRVSRIAFLAFKRRIQTNASNHNVRIFSNQFCLGNAVIPHAKRLHTILEQMTALAVEHADAMFLRIGTNSCKEGHIAAGTPIVIAFKCRNAVRIRTDNADRADFLCIQRQDAVIAQQHHALFCRFECQRIVFIRVIFSERNSIVLAVIREAPKQIACRVHALASGRNLLFRDEPFLICRQHMQVCVAAVDIASVLEGKCSRFRRGIRHMMMLMEITDCPAVGRHMPLKLPLVAQNIHQQRFRAAGRLAIDAVIRTHDALHLCFLHCRLERRQIRFRHILLAGNCVKRVTNRLGTGVYGKMLCAGGYLQVLAAAL